MSRRGGKQPQQPRGTYGALPPTANSRRRTLPLLALRPFRPDRLPSVSAPGLFETHPECQDVFFLFRDVDDLQQLKMSKELQAHGLRVMSFIEKSVARLDRGDKLEALAFELGKNHFHYKAPPDYYEYIGIQFIQAVRPILQDDWTLEVEKAWEGLFQHLVAVMRRGFDNEGKRLGAKTPPPPPRAEAEPAPDPVR